MEVVTGQQLPTMSRTPTTRQLVKYSVATGELSEIHYDMDRVAALGARRPLVHGGLKAAWLAQLLRAWAGEDAKIRSLRVSYRGMDIADKEYQLGGVVTEATETSTGWEAHIELWGQDDEGQRTTTGRAVVEVPR